MSAAASPTFAVVDVETTGFHARGRDRVIEIAVVRMDARGTIEDEYATLVNPERDIGCTAVHGIRAADVVDAPRFEEIAGDVLERLRGAVVGGHNVRFDRSFLLAEYARLGHQLPDLPCVCTLSLSRAAAPALSVRKLTHCCQHFGVPLHDAHSALADARATAQLLARLLATREVERARAVDALARECACLADAPWPNLTASGRRLLREEAKANRVRAVSYIARLLQRMDDTQLVDADTAAYLQMLDRVLEDRVVTQEEADTLFAVAGEWGLSRRAAEAAHESYLRALVRAAWDDGVVTEVERRDLASVSRLLGVGDAKLEVYLDEERVRDGISASVPPRSSAESLEGMSVCFTGELLCRLDGAPISRSGAERIATEHGLVVKKGVTKKLDLLVVADPDSMSGKARKARQYGTRIMAEAVFWRALGLPVE